MSVVMIGLASLLSGCNTVKGFGQDVSAGGKALTKAAKDVEGNKSKQKQANSSSKQNGKSQNNSATSN